MSRRAGRLALTTGTRIPSRRLVSLVSLLAGVALVLLASVACLGGPRPGADASTSGAGGAASAPRVTTAEVWYTTAPAAGVWAELRIIMNNPLPARGQRTILYLPATVMEDFTVRSTEPGLLIPPSRAADGRYEFSFPAPIPVSPNWYRVNLVFRGTRARPIRLALLIDGLSGIAGTRPVMARVVYADRRADPFKVVPEPLVAWLPATGRASFPLVVGFAGLLGVTALVGAAAGIYSVRKAGP